MTLTDRKPANATIRNSNPPHVMTVKAILWGATARSMARSVPFIILCMFYPLAKNVLCAKILRARMPVTFIQHISIIARLRVYVKVLIVWSYVPMSTGYGVASLPPWAKEYRAGSSYDGFAP